MAASTAAEEDGALGRVVRRVREEMDAWGEGDRPFLTLTYAQSIDGSIAAERGAFSWS
jgi:hypothetical protein